MDRHRRILDGHRIGLPAQHQQQLLALVRHRNDVNLPHRAAAIFHGLVPVQHRGELDQHVSGLGGQQIQHTQDVGRAVGDGECAAAVLIPPCGVDDDDVRAVRRRQERGGVGVDDLCVAQSQQIEVMAGDGAQIRLPLHVHGLGEVPRHGGEVDAEPAGQVNQSATTWGGGGDVGGGSVGGRRGYRGVVGFVGLFGLGMCCDVGLRGGSVRRHEPRRQFGFVPGGRLR